jgi:hypothetical protein
MDHPNSLKWKQLAKQAHPEYQPKYWARCRALYKGGPALLRDDPVMADVFPQHSAEGAEVYKERKAAAYYINYPGSIIDGHVAALFEEQPAMEASPKPDAWYEDWFNDVSKPGGRTLTFNDLLKQQILTALVLRRAWTLVELPGPQDVDADDESPASLADQEESGALDCYAVPVDPECVQDWEMNDDGALSWALLHFRRQKRNSLTALRNKVEEEFVLYDTDSWARYTIEYDIAKPPTDETDVPLNAEGPHTFGRVPLSLLELSDGLWAMSKLESLAAAHMNVINSLSWATIKSLFPTPVFFQGDENMLNPQSEDASRFAQARSPAHHVRLSKDDRYEFVGPSSEPFAQAAAQANTLRDEMYRTDFAMADSVDNSGAALQRSGDSKAMDMRKAAIVNKRLGEYLHEFAVDVMELVGAGRGDAESEWVMHGMEEFDTPDPEGMLAEAQIVTTLDLNSPTFQAAYKYKVAKALGGDDFDGATLSKIQRELVTNNPPEVFDPQRKIDAQDALTAAAMTPDSPANPGEDDGDDDSNPDKKPDKKDEKKPDKKAKAK